MSKFIFILIVLTISSVFKVELARADHFQTICTTEDAYDHISNTRYGESGRDKGGSTKIKGLGSCYRLKPGTVVVVEKSRKGCRYIHKQFFKNALIYSDRGFRRLKNKGGYMYMGR